MSVEIERKFLVDTTKLKDLPNGTVIKQGYIPTENQVTVRVRLKGEKAFLTLKGKSEGISRTEFEYQVPMDEAEEMLGGFCGDRIEKTRYEIAFGSHTWELDIFEGLNKGLVIAEIELQNENEQFDLPEWVTDEVSDDMRYYNINLMKNPFTRW